MPRELHPKPRLLLTGFSVFPGAPVNPTEALVRELRRDPGEIGARSDFRAEVLDVDYMTIGEQLAAIAAVFEPDIAIHFGLAANATGFRLEKYGRNLANPERADNRGQFASGVIEDGGPDRHESTLPRREILDALCQADLPAALDDQAGDYLCNAVFYLSCSGGCGLFKPKMSGFIHVPQLPVEDGGIAGDGARLPLKLLVRGAKLAASTCLDIWQKKTAAA